MRALHGGNRNHVKEAHGHLHTGNKAHIAVVNLVTRPSLQAMLFRWLYAPQIRVPIPAKEACGSALFRHQSSHHYLDVITKPSLQTRLFEKQS